MNRHFNQNNAAFDTRFAEEQADAAKSAERGFTDLSKSLRGLIDMQAVEIERLRGIIEKAENLPERRAETLTLSSYMGDRYGRVDVGCRASDGSMWLLRNAGHYDSDGWERLPDLPQAVDEMNGSTPRAHDEGDDE
ncbi:MAG: hypothetical protein KGQ79_10725 [Proteobacteria bacterium]|nr:hypothetical protein [Pseudomonadota bacterium]MDE2238755.1 hypothetical protein [Rhodospirillales bacterium]